jgi:putative ABC transport system ATP-binding protein|nr:ABC transporter ATP-binding protein [uncultured Butyrivibrio sp.]
MGTLINLQNVGKTYITGSVANEVLKNVNLSIDEGEMVVILGPSGSGKSTLLNMLGGLDSATCGTITFGEKTVTALDDSKLSDFRAEDVGIVFQFYNLIPTLTAMENVALMSELGVEIMDPMEALELVGLKGYENKFPSQMSGGQQQRVAIARAIAKRPRLLLCDEPTGALDTKTGKEILKLLNAQSKDGKRTVIMVTHNAAFADIADKVIYVKNGTVEKIVTNEHPKDADEIEC